MLPHEQPFNISLIDPSRQRLAGLLPVQTMDIYDTQKNFHPQGLYSTEIFGLLDEPTRYTKHGFIDMRTTVIHPKIFEELNKLKRLYQGIMAGTHYAVFDPILKDFVKSNVIDGKTGYKFFTSHLSDIKFEHNMSGQRDLRIDLMTKGLPKAMVRYLIVLPAGIREIEINSDGRVVEDDVNELYRKVIRGANAVPTSGDTTVESLDKVRWNIQQAFNAIYKYLLDMLSGKNGFLLKKWGGRAIFGGTRNVITAMDPAPMRLGDPHGIKENQTIVGLDQYMKGNQSKTIYNLRNGIFSNIINAMPNRVTVIDPATLLPVDIEPSLIAKTEWGTEDGLLKLINIFTKLEVRHRPVLIDGHYAKLIYKKKNGFLLLNSIDELPDWASKEDVKPLTWVEYLYLDTYQDSRDSIGFITRFPVLGDGSIYPSYIRLTSTAPSQYSHPFTETGELNKDITFPTFPIEGNAFFDSMSVSPTRELGLGADHDGDKTSLHFMNSLEAKKDTQAYLNSKAAYLSSTGDLRYGFNGSNFIAEMTLHNFTQGLN